MGQICPLGAPRGCEKILNHGDFMDIATLYHPIGTSFNMNNFHAVGIKGMLDQPRLRKAIDSLQERHPRMRARLYINPLTKYNYLLESKELIPLTVQYGTSASINTDLEKILLREINSTKGPFCHITYVKHEEEGTGLLVFCNNHGVGDGRCCETMLSQLLLIYDGKDVPHGKTCAGLFQVLGPDVRREKVDTWRDIEAQMPARERDSILESFVDPTHPEYLAKFEGIALEFFRLEPEETDRLRSLCRRERTTVTGAVAAAVQFTILRELVRRNRRTEFVNIGFDMNLRGRQLGPEYDQECGNFVLDVQLRIGFEEHFWKCARHFTSLVKQIVDNKCGIEAMQCSMGEVLNREAMMLQKELPPEASAAAMSSMEHCNISSLGVLKRFVTYSDFEVLENFTGSNIGFMGSKVNLCTSGSSGRMTVCVMVSKNVVPRSRKLAQGIRDGIGHTLQGLLAGGVSEQQVLDECGEAVVAMRDVMAKRLAEVEVRRRQGGKSASGEVFMGDISGRHSCETHCKIIVNMVGSTLASGALLGYPFYQHDLKEAGVFNYVCGDDEQICDAQDLLLTNFFSYSVHIANVVFMFMGLWFDFLGARVSSVLGGVLSSLSCLGVSLAVSLDSKAVPVTHTALLYGCTIAADAGGFVASLSLLGWLWHYPRSQTLLIGLSQGTNQLAVVLGVCVHALVRGGFSVPASFCIMSASGALSVPLLLFTAPTQKEFYDEAGRVLNMRPQSLAAQRPSWWGLRFQLRTLWGCLSVFPVHNALMYCSNAAGMVGTLLWVAWWGPKSRVVFGRKERNFLNLVFEASLPIGAIMLNPLSGMLMDRIGLPRFCAIVTASALGMMCTEPVNTVAGQALFICFWSIYLGTSFNVFGKWPVHFVPPSVFGITSGTFQAFSGVCGVVFMGAATLLHLEGDAPVFLFLLCSSLLFTVGTILLLWKGLPRKPPQNKYDSAARLLEM